MTTWIGHPNGAWRWTGTAPRTYISRAGHQRGFCGTCGSPMFYASHHYPDETHFYAALLDDPNSVRPSCQFHRAEQLAWLHLSDALPDG